MAVLFTCHPNHLSRPLPSPPPSAVVLVVFNLHQHVECEFTVNGGFRLVFQMIKQGWPVRLIDYSNQVHIKVPSD